MGLLPTGNACVPAKGSKTENYESFGANVICNPQPKSAEGACLLFESLGPLVVLGEVVVYREGAELEAAADPPARNPESSPVEFWLISTPPPPLLQVAGWGSPG